MNTSIIKEAKRAKRFSTDMLGQFHVVNSMFHVHHKFLLHCSQPGFTVAYIEIVRWIVQLQLKYLWRHGGIAGSLTVQKHTDIGLAALDCPNFE